MLDIREDFHVHSSYNDHSSPDLTVKNALEKAARDRNEDGGFY